MTAVPSPLQYGDPPQLGPFVIQARLQVAAAGFVYLGQAPDGRAVSVAVLTRGAALDGAARDRFVTAVEAAMPVGVRRWMRSRTAVLDDVVAADLGQAPWVAVAYTPGRAGAERFLEPVMVGGTLIGQAHGPDFVPYWLTDRAPALPGPPKPRPPLTETARRVAIAAVALAILLILGALIAILLMLGRDESEPQPRPLPPTVVIPTPPPTPVTPEPQEPTPSPSPTQSGSGSPGPTSGDESSEDGSI
ncbi:hypothetical protein ACIBG8_01460 [Nonomuraea sp. NPDC050556]|uniref:hypothetical protein n=1 Tax=Nonomuraea sp. NPDC050556 TaxID=3364369 RepID=UPI0037A52E90